MNKRILTGQILLNVGTVLTVALLLFAYHAWAAPVTEVAPAAVVATSAPTVITATTMLPDGVTVNSVMPGVISYQATLTDANGKPLSGNLNLTFGLYATPTGSTALWTETRSGANAVPVDAGLFNVMLGSLTPIPSDVWSNDILYLGVQVGSDTEMTPREVVGAVPMAMTVPDGAIGMDQIADEAVTSDKLDSHLCCGHTNPNGTGWVDYGDDGIYIDVNTLACNFTATPMYFTSLAGDNNHWTTTGATSIYSPSASGFRVYVRGISGAISSAFANSKNWHIQWCGIKK